MSFWSKVGDAFKKIGTGIASAIPGFGISVASNAIGGAMSAKDAKKQHQYDLEKMKVQHGYNRMQQQWTYGKKPTTRHKWGSSKKLD